MGLDDWIKAGDKRGAWLAAKLGVTRQAVFNWRRRGVPAVWHARVSKATRGAVPVKAMRT